MDPGFPHGSSPWAEGPRECDFELAPACIRLNAIFSSDIGHFDVPDMTGVLPEAYEMVEDELVTPADFRDFTFTNVVRLFGTANPRFFEGTGVEAAVAQAIDAGLEEE